MTTNLLKTIRPLHKTGGVIKATSLNTFSGHLVRYHDSDRKDLSGEWFSKKTHFMFHNYPVKGAPINYQHGMDDEFGFLPIGMYTFVDEDDVGLFVEGQLKTREEYQEMLRELGRVKGIPLTDAQIKQRSDIAYKAVTKLISSVPMQQSMGADIATYRVNEKNGHIDYCGIVHGALTPTPADDINPVVQFKSAWQYVTALDDNRTTFIFQDQSTDDNTKSQTVNPTQVIPTRATVETDMNGQTKQSNQQENDTMARKSLKELSPEDNESLRSLIKEIILELNEESGMEADDADIVAMVDEAENDIKNADEDEMKAESTDDEDDGTKAEDIDEDEMTKRVKKHFNLPTKMKSYLDKQLKLQQNRKNIAQGALSKYKDTAPAKTKKSSVGGFQDNSMSGYAPTQQQSRITVEEERRYAGLTGEQMALGLKIAVASRFPYGVPAGLKMQDLVNTGVVSEGYIKTMAQKAGVVMRHENSFKSHGAYDNMMAHDRIALKSAMPFKADELDSVAITNQGAEWAFIWYDTRLWERARHETRLFNLLVSKGMRTADVTGKTMDVKLNTGSPTLYTAPEARSVDATGRPEAVVQTTPFTTSNVQVDVKKHMLATAFTDELDEDSIINIQAFLDQDVVQTVSEGIESALINGDTTASSSNINTDGTPASGIQTPLYIAWDGLRHHVLEDNTGQGNAKADTLEVDDYERTIKLFDSTIRNRRDQMLFVIDSDTESHTRRLVQLTTKDVAGDQATIFYGDIPKLFGVETYMSGFLGLSQADGTISTNTPANNTEGQILCVYAPYWQFGRKRDVQIELQRYPESSSTVVVASVRHTLASRGANGATMTYDITVSD